MKNKNIKIEEILLLIKNQVPGPYILKYWNLDYGYSNPEVFRGDLIILDGEYDVDKDTKIWAIGVLLMLSSRTDSVGILALQFLIGLIMAIQNFEIASFILTIFKRKI